MARIVDTLYDTTSASGGSLSADVETSKYSALLLVAIAAGANPPTNTWTVSDKGTGTAVLLGGLTEPTAGSSIGQGVGPSYTLAFPVPRRTQVDITAGASSTVRLVIYGIQET